MYGAPKPKQIPMGLNVFTLPSFLILQVNDVFIFDCIQQEFNARVVATQPRRINNDEPINDG